MAGYSTALDFQREDAVSALAQQQSKVWFTLSHGILNEVYFPRVDQACTRDMGFIVTNGSDFFSEEKRNCTFKTVLSNPVFRRMKWSTAATRVDTAYTKRF